MPTHFPEISALETLAAMASATAPTLLDVRLPEDQDGTRIPGTMRVPHDDPDTQIAACPHGAIVICHKGLKISAGVTARLHLRGVPAHRLRGGHVGWRDAGLALADDPAPTRLALPLDASAVETLSTWATLRFRTPRAELLEVPRADLDGVCARFDAVTPTDLPDLPGLAALAGALDTVTLALPACRPSALFPTFDLAFRGALRHETETSLGHLPLEEART